MPRAAAMSFKWKPAPNSRAASRAPGRSSPVTTGSAAFVPDLQVSRVVSRERNSALVEQRGAARLLFFSYPMDVRLAITEYPRERVESRAVAGNFREMQSTYTLEMREGRVLLRYSGRMVPDFYVPPLIGTFVLRHHVESAFRALVDEIERGQGDPEKP